MSCALPAADEDDERFSNLSPALKRKIHVAIFYNALMKIKMFGYHDEVVAEIKTVKNYVRTYARRLYFLCSPMRCLISGLAARCCV